MHSKLRLDYNMEANGIEVGESAEREGWRGLEKLSTSCQNKPGV